MPIPPNPTYQTKPTKQNPPNQTKPTKRSLTNQNYQTKPYKPYLPNQTKPCHLSHQTKAIQHYWLKQSTSGSVVPLAMFIPLLKGKAQVLPSTVGQECSGNGPSKHTRSSTGKALKSCLDLDKLCEASLHGFSRPSHTSIEVSLL